MDARSQNEIVGSNRENQKIKKNPKVQTSFQMANFDKNTFPLKNIQAYILHKIKTEVKYYIKGQKNDICILI